MAAVYLAPVVQLDRAVALKVPHFGPDDDTRVLARFYREARAAATLSHPGSCPGYDVGAVDGIQFLTMPCIQGQPLTKRLAAGAPMSPLHVYHPLVSPGGTSYLVEGRSGTRDGHQTIATRVWDSLSGKVLWTTVWPDTPGGAGEARPDPSGHIVYLTLRYDGGPALLSMRTKEPRASLARASIQATSRRTPPYLSLTGPGRFVPRRRDDERPAFAVRTGSDASSATCSFDLAGTHVAWGNADGSVIVCDIPEAQKRLTAVALPW